MPKKLQGDAALANGPRLLAKLTTNYIAEEAKMSFIRAFPQTVVAQLVLAGKPPADKC